MKTASTEHLKCNELYFRIISLEFPACYGRGIYGKERVQFMEGLHWFSPEVIHCLRCARGTH